jgi:hypothetical protein
MFAYSGLSVWTWKVFNYIIFCKFVFRWITSNEALLTRNQHLTVLALPFHTKQLQHIQNPANPGFARGFPTRKKANRKWTQPKTMGHHQYQFHFFFSTKCQRFGALVYAHRPCGLTAPPFFLSRNGWNYIPVRAVIRGSPSYITPSVVQQDFH